MSRTQRVVVISLFPEMFSALTESGITRRAFSDQLLKIHFINPREFTTDKHQTVDDRPYGGGPGMVMRVEPMLLALKAAKGWLENQAAKVIYLSPQGQRLDQPGVEVLAEIEDLILICGRYEGIDERFIEAEVDQEWSIGDYVLSGGELPAMVLLDALIRRIPGALGDANSAEQDSFVDGLLDCPHYTRPEEFEGQRVPDILLSGDHGKIAQWRAQQSLKRTAKRRPDLLAKLDLSAEQQQWLNSSD